MILNNIYLSFIISIDYVIGFEFLLRREKLFLKYINMPTHIRAYTFEINSDVNKRRYIVCSLSILLLPFLLLRNKSNRETVQLYRTTFFLQRCALHTYISYQQLIDIKAILNDSNKSVECIFQNESYILSCITKAKY